DVDGAEQLLEPPDPTRAAEVEPHLLLRPVEQLVQLGRAAARTVGPGDRLGLEDLRAGPGEHRTARRTRPHAAEVRDPEAGGAAGARGSPDRPGEDRGALGRRGGLAEGRDRQAEQRAPGHDLVASEPRATLVHLRPPFPTPARREAEPGGEQLHVVGAAEGGGQPAVGRFDQVARPAAADLPATAEAEELDTSGERVGAVELHRLTERRAGSADPVRQGVEAWEEA